MKNLSTNSSQLCSELILRSGGSSTRNSARHKVRTYSELITLQTYEERFNYLKLGGKVGADTFGFDRHFNQNLYQKDPRWKDARDKVIIRDNGCDLGVEGYDIHGSVIVHHMNPITLEDIINDDPKIFDPEFLISTVHRTHNAIHYGDETLLNKAPIQRKPNDMCPWRITKD